MDKEELKQKLTPLQYEVTQNKGTEAPGTGVYLDNKENGMYHCVVCNASLFPSDTKFDSRSGWPSFFDPVNKKAVVLKEDTSHGMARTEVTCASCGAHLGHIFPDAPTTPTGNRYCINSCALTFTKEKDGLE